MTLREKMAKGAAKVSEEEALALLQDFKTRYPKVWKWVTQSSPGVRKRHA